MVPKTEFIEPLATVKDSAMNDLSLTIHQHAENQDNQLTQTNTPTY